MGVFRHESDSEAEIGGGGASHDAQPAALRPPAAPTGHWQHAAASGMAACAQPQVSRPSADMGDGPSQLDDDTCMMPEGPQSLQQRKPMPAQPARQVHMEDQLGHGAHSLVSQPGPHHQQPAAAQSLMSHPPATMDLQPTSLSSSHASRRCGPPPAKQQRMQPPEELHLQPQEQPPAEAPVSHHSSAAAPGPVRPCAAPQSAASRPTTQRSSAPDVLTAGLIARAGMPPVQPAQHSTSQQSALQQSTHSHAQQPAWQPPVVTQPQPPLQQRQLSPPQQQEAMPGPLPSTTGVNPADRLVLQPSQAQPHSPDDDAEPARASQPDQMPQVSTSTLRQGLQRLLY